MFKQPLLALVFAVLSGASVFGALYEIDHAGVWAELGMIVLAFAFMIGLLRTVQLTTPPGQQ
ncbi:hypothetical protein [Nocardioides acrostichi]|uniref:Uncharacterized protein n=1 Tax=Nocardioides acrostichi TaxID=2784339 RepID=A0A930UXS9_9ACTN|nr:hypothetical protein [Nocardioides acrostichi]MBF4162843.1 hypothetical protein [Nocardioides acrostichi]